MNFSEVGGLQVESLVAGLVGALIGAGASVITVWLQTRAQSNRERLRIVMELALEDYKISLEFARASGRRTMIPPVTLFLHYHLEFAKVMEKGEISTDDIKRIVSENQKFSETIKNAQPTSGE